MSKDNSSIMDQLKAALEAAQPQSKSLAEMFTIRTMPRDVQIQLQTIRKSAIEVRSAAQKMVEMIEDEMAAAQLAFCTTCSNVMPLDRLDEQMVCILCENDQTIQRLRDEREPSPRWRFIND